MQYSLASLLLAMGAVCIVLGTGACRLIVETIIAASHAGSDLSLFTWLSAVAALAAAILWLAKP